MRLHLLLFLLIGVVVSGCQNSGFQDYKPFETNKYDSLLEPVTGNARYWIRGETSGDLDGDSTEEVVILASLHNNPTPKGAGDFQKIVLLLGSRNGAGGIDLRLRRTIFLPGKTFQQASPPLEVYFHQDPMPTTQLTNCAAHIFDVDGKGKGVIVVSVWGKKSAGLYNVWHAVFSLRKKNGHDELVPALSVRTRQRTPDIKTMDINRDGVDELILAQQVLVGDSKNMPEWVTVYARGSDGKYTWQNRTHPTPYQRRMLNWYQYYVKNFQQTAEKNKLAQIEYYLGLMHHYTGDQKAARRFLRRAAMTSDANLRTHVATALAQLGGKKPTTQRPPSLTEPQLP